MAQTKIVVVLGNCQAQMLEGMLGHAGQNVTVKRLPPVFELTEQDRPTVVAAFEKADHIFAQRVSDDYHLEWARPSHLRENFPHKALIWPNLYFDGYFPDAQYMYRAPYGKVQGPLDDYHLRRVFEAHKAGRTATSAVESIVRGDPKLDTNAFEKSFDQLTLREKDVDVIISDFVRSEVGRRRSFYTPNHPFNTLLVEMARRLADRVDLLFSMERAEAFPYSLDRIYIRTHPSIRASYSLPFSEPETYLGRKVETITPDTIQLGAEQHYTPAELVDEFYRLYDNVFANAR
jgi:Polysaccharide biosynthesis enzyme WcbI